MKPAVRIATENDVEEILDLMQGFYAYDNLDYNKEKSRETLRYFINSNHGSLFVIELPDKIVGYFCLAFGYSLELHGKDCFLDELYLEQEYRQQGYGSEIMKFIEDHLKKNGFKAIHLIVFEKNTGAQQYYIKNGFRTRDAIFMTKSLD